MNGSIELVQPVYTYLPYTAYIHLSDDDMQKATKYKIEYDWVVNPANEVVDMHVNQSQPFADFVIKHSNVQLSITCTVYFINRSTGIVEDSSVYTLNEYYVTTFDGENTIVDRSHTAPITSPPSQPVIADLSITRDPLSELFSSFLIKFNVQRYIHSYTTNFILTLDKFRFDSATKQYQKLDDNGAVVAQQTLYTSGDLDSDIYNNFKILYFDNTRVYVQFVRKGEYHITATITDYNNDTYTIDQTFTVTDIMQPTQTTAINNRSVNYLARIPITILHVNNDTFEAMFEYIVNIVQSSVLIAPDSLNISQYISRFRMLHFKLYNDSCVMTLACNNLRSITEIVGKVWYALMFTIKLLGLDYIITNKPRAEITTLIGSNNVFDDLVDTLNANYENYYSLLNKDVIYDTVVVDINNILSAYNNIDRALESVNMVSFIVGT